MYETRLISEINHFPAQWVCAERVNVQIEHNSQIYIYFFLYNAFIYFYHMECRESFSAHTAWYTSNKATLSLLLVTLTPSNSGEGEKNRRTKSLMSLINVNSAGEQKGQIRCHFTHMRNYIYIQLYCLHVKKDIRGDFNIYIVEREAFI